MKRFHEYSRASRFRIRRLVREAANNGAVQESSSSDEEVNFVPPALHRRNRRAPAGEFDIQDEDMNALPINHLGHPNSASSDTDSNDEAGNEERILGVENQANPNSRDASDLESIDSNSMTDVAVSDESDEGEPLHDEDEIQHEEDDGWNVDDDFNIYNLAPITVGESMLAILSFYLRHNLSQACLSDLLSLIDLHCRNEGKRFKNSVHLFKKYFSNVQLPVIKHFYCSVCFQTVPNANDVCQDNHTSGNDFFIQISVLSQLEALYKRPGFREKLNYRFNRSKFIEANYEDIYDGAVYKELSQDGNILSDPSNISLMWYTDGVSVFKSSKYEIWPFYFVMNELPYNDRTKVSNALLAGLWFGRSKPAPASFLPPIRDDLLTLRQGVNMSIGRNPVVNMIVKDIVICGTADIPAKAKFLNFKSHNSNYGCAKCKICTINIRRGLNVYPYRERLELRVEQETSMHAQEALTRPVVNGVRSDLFGVKGPTVLSQFVHCWVRSTSIDEMHCIFNGVMKSLLLLWFDSKFSRDIYSLYAYKDLVNVRLAGISPPSFVQRLTRTLDDVKYWKAHEMKTFLFYYSLPVLSDLMGELVLDHHKLLVLGVYLLNQRSISGNDVNVASEVLTEYVSQFADIYGIENMTCNLHQLLHLSTVVQDFGPLWVTSCFPFEDLNGKLKKLVKGTRYAELQVCSGVSMFMKLAELTNRIPDNSKASSYVSKLFDVNLRVKTISIGHRLAIVGKCKKKNVLPQLVQEALQNSNVVGRNYFEFYRFIL